MKKFVFIALLATQLMNAENVRDSINVDIMNRKNEVRVDLLSLIATSKLNISYERFLGSKFSVGVALGYSKSAQINVDFDRGYRNSLPEYEVNPFVRYKLSRAQLHFYFAEVFVSANGGQFKEIVRETTGTAAYYNIEKSAYSDFGIGAGVGYKAYIKQKFPIEVMVGFGTNLFNKEKSPDVLSRVGVSFGYRF